MKSHDELRTFCMGYLHGALGQADDLSDVDDWTTWGGYYINLTGSYYCPYAKGRTDLWVSAYTDKEDMSTLDEPLVSFLVEVTEQEVTA